MRKPRRSYDAEFKKMIVELYESGKKAAEIAEEYDMNPNNIHRWHNEIKDHGKSSFPGNGNKQLTAEQAEIERLKKELREAELERDILKKAVSIFSKKDTKFSGS